MMMMRRKCGKAWGMEPKVLPLKSFSGYVTSSHHHSPPMANTLLMDSISAYEVIKECLMEP